MKILFFARLRDNLGSAEASLTLPQPMPVHQVLDRLLQQHPDWQQAFSSPVLVAVNQTMADLNAMVADEDELAFFPPVTGG